MSAHTPGPWTGNTATDTVRFEYIGGVGRNAKFIVHKNGSPVAMLDRFSVRAEWEISSKHYGVKLGGARTLEHAKEKAAAIDYPSEACLYELVCTKVAKDRRVYMEKKHAHDLGRIAREIIAGSNSAREELEKLVTEMDRWIMDRTQTRKNEFTKNQQHFEATGERVYPETTPYYPDPPGFRE